MTSTRRRSRATPAHRTELSFHCIGADEVPEQTTALLHAACDRQGVRFVPHSTDEALPTRPLGKGDMLYRPAASTAAHRLEELLWNPNVSTFYRNVEGPIRGWRSTVLGLRQAGVSIPRTTLGISASPKGLRQAERAVGGLPLLVKLPGLSGGAGVLRAESRASLKALVEMALGTGRVPLLQEYLRGVMHWRVVVVGDRAVAAFPNPLRDGDFRSAPSDAPPDYLSNPPKWLERLAVQATHGMQVELGGVDVLVRGRKGWVLEVNFPLYHPRAEEVARLPVSDAMVAWLKSKALMRSRS